MPQSFSRYWTVPSPMPCAGRVRGQRWRAPGRTAARRSRPSAPARRRSRPPRSSPPATRRPPSAGRTTTLIGRLYFRANSKSRWSCAGTAITAPVPYSTSTKLATQIGTGLVGERIDRLAAGVEAFLLDLAGHARRAVLRLEPRPARSANCIAARLAAPLLHQRMLGGEQQEGGAVDRVDPRREDLDARRRPLAGFAERKRDPRALGPADPVPLHRQNLLGPVVQALGRLQQLVGVAA